jgi:HAD superfamily hydrolase (TIGR01509 family)
LTPPELVIFDCDGVLVDSEPIANRILAAALVEAGLDTTYEETTRETTGLSMASVLAWAEGRLGRPLPANFEARVQTDTFAAFRRDLAPVPGVAEALDQIDLPVCVASSGEVAKIRLSLGLTGLLPRFEGRIFSAAQVARGKPFPDLFLHAAKAMQAQPAGCAVIEDSVPGVQAARAAGMDVLAYAAGGAEPGLAAAGARTFADMAELSGLLGLA